jgi:DNA-binding CsgD family transcriptional regulator
MSLDEGLSRFIGRLYEAAYDSETWNRAMRELMERTGSRLVFIASVDLREREYTRTDFYGPETSVVEVAQREYREKFYPIDPTLEWASKHPSTGMCETESVMPSSEYLENEYVKWNKSRFGTTHWRVLYNQPIDDLSFALSLHPPSEEGAPSKNLRPLHRLIFEHMERALRLAARPPDFSRDSGAVLALGHHGGIVAMSKRAEELLAARDGLGAERGRLTATSAECAARLNEAIRQCACSAIGAGGPGGGVRIRRVSGRSDWLALVSPYPRFLEHLPFPTPAAVVRIVETDSHSPLADEHARLFELTHREAEIASALLKGHSLESLAAQLSISRNTAKVHLQSLFRKTDTNRQIDLVRVLTEVTH